MTQCTYFGVCGGCQNQHLSYQQQLTNKLHRVQYLLQLYYKGNISMHSGKEYNYRNRMDFVVASKIIGFRQVDERKLIDIHNCPISDERLNKLLSQTREAISNSSIEPFDRMRKNGVLKYAVIRVADDTCVSFVLNEDSPKLAQTVEAIRAMTETIQAENIVIAYVAADKDESTSLECFAVKGSEFLTATFLGKKIEFHSQGFFQNNTEMAQELVEHVKIILEKHDSKNKTVIDAYGGVGTFGCILAESAKHVISIESHPAASEACSRNIIANDVSNMTAINADAETLRKVDVPSDALFVIDPPRSGLSDKTLKYLLEKRPELIVYVSCNPNQLAKELVQLRQHYTVEDVAVFDLFPQTNHVEVVATLVRNRSR